MPKLRGEMLMYRMLKRTSAGRDIVYNFILRSSFFTSNLSTNCRPQKRFSVKNDGNTVRREFISNVSIARYFSTEIFNSVIMWLCHRDDSMQNDTESEESTRSE